MYFSHVRLYTYTCGDHGNDRIMCMHIVCAQANIHRDRKVLIEQASHTVHARLVKSIVPLVSCIKEIYWPSGRPHVATALLQWNAEEV